MSVSYKHVKEWRKRAKERAVAALGGECVCCGYKYCINALDFHHLNPKEKDFGISTSILAWSKIVVELRKCVLVCCRCHREIHNGLRTVPANAKRFDESFAQIEPKIDETPCPICGNLKLFSARTCSKKCANKFKQKIDWDAIDLKELLKIATPEKLGRQLGVSGNCIRRKIKIW